MSNNLRWTKSDYEAYQRLCQERIKLNEKIIKSTEIISVLPVEPVYSSPLIMSFVIEHDPVPAPRMTRQDKWLNPRRPCVQRYFDYRAVLKKKVGVVATPDEIHLQFHFEMPKSWSKKKRIEMFGQPHKSPPDRDNLEKAVLDSLFDQDCSVWKGHQEKRWAITGRVEIHMFWHAKEEVKL